MSAPNITPFCRPIFVPLLSLRVKPFSPYHSSLTIDVSPFYHPLSASRGPLKSPKHYPSFAAPFCPLISLRVKPFSPYQPSLTIHFSPFYHTLSALCGPPYSGPCQSPMPFLPHRPSHHLVSCAVPCRDFFYFRVRDIVIIVCLPLTSSPILLRIH